ncbi:hypothetical protein GCM10010326_25060 [Streptomyces xanthochromogenes]|uniref:Uncharacterized protein n=1 Tax=Streptomyces xanthochromogenes TaxID=67384 RepID=A0ABQ3A1Y4_9ACTN|nr:hypothetical protein GCM10010326_25060 [Streptomyces xanthochromogenes]
MPGTDSDGAAGHTWPAAPFSLCTWCSRSTYPQHVFALHMTELDATELYVTEETQPP